MSNNEALVFQQRNQEKRKQMGKNYLLKNKTYSLMREVNMNIKELMIL